MVSIHAAAVVAIIPMAVITVAAVPITELAVLTALTTVAPAALTAPTTATIALATRPTTTVGAATASVKRSSYLSFEIFLPIWKVKMDILRRQPASLQALWPSVPASLQMDILDILQSDLTDAEKTAAMEAASVVKTQEAFIPSNPLLQKERAEANDAAEALLYKPEVSKLSLECPFCKSNNTIIVSSQTRSADEATPVRIVCLSCSKTSIERG